MPETRSSPYLLIAAAVLAAAFCLTPWGRPLDYAAYDTWFQIRGPEPIRDDIVFVAIDESSFQEIGQQWPWPRALHARLLESVFQAGAKVVVIDILFPEPSTAYDDAALADALQRYGPNILAADINRSEDNRFVIENNIRPLEIFRTASTKIGHIRTPTDSDGFVRRADLQLRDLKSLGYAAALAFTDQRCCQQLPDAGLPLINYSGGPDTITTFSYYQALDPPTYLPEEALRDKLVIVGVNTTSSAMPDERRPDHFPTPMTRWGAGYSPGSFVHANVAANLLDENFLSSVGLLTAAAIGCLLAMAFGFGTINLSLRNSSLIAILLAFSIASISYWLFKQQLVYVSPVAMLLPVFASYVASPYYRYLIEARQRAFIRKAFSTYVNPAIVEQLEQNPENVRLGGKQVEGTALFVDIADFAKLTESHNPETVINFVNNFLSELIDIAMETGGTVERFLGDAIMVIWGVPIEQDRHAELACVAAIDMTKAISSISERESEHLGMPISARIGINSGSMTAGNIGTNRRFNYTVLGDSVNLAARLEALNKLYGTTVLVGSTTVEALPDEILVREIDTVRVTGREHVETVYELLGRPDDLTAIRRAAVSAYAQGLARYRARDWTAAAAEFSAGLQADPDDGPCGTMRTRCEAYTKAPPENPDGVFRAELK